MQLQPDRQHHRHEYWKVRLQQTHRLQRAVSLHKFTFFEQASLDFLFSSKEKLWVIGTQILHESEKTKLLIESIDTSEGK